MSDKKDRLIKSFIEQVAELEKIVKRQQAMLNFQTAQYNWMYELSIKRESTIANLEETNKILTEQVIAEQDIHSSLIVAVRRDNES